MSVRFQQLSQAGKQQKHGILHSYKYNHLKDNLSNSEISQDLTPCQNPKNCLLFAILVFLGFVMYLPFVPYSSHRPIAFVWPSNQSRDANVLARPSENTTKIWPDKICSSKPSNATDVLVIVCSAMSNFVERQAIRDSWASETNSDLSNIKVIFLVGHVGNESSPLQVNVTRESEIHGDILQEDFIDSYANLTVKSLMLLKFFTQNCDQVPYLLKTDDDVYINLVNLNKLVQMNRKPNLLIGSLICGAVPIRDPYNKYYAPKYMYDKKRYPNYLSGTGYLMSQSIAKTLFEASLSNPVFHMEDIFITGILAQASGIRPQDHVGFSYVKRRAAPCLYSQIISSHHLSVGEMSDMFDKVKAKVGKCAPMKKKFLRSYGPGKCLWAAPT